MNYTFFLSLSVFCSSVLWGNGLKIDQKVQYDEPAYCLLMRQLYKEFKESTSKSFIMQLKSQSTQYYGISDICNTDKKQIGCKVCFTVNRAKQWHCNSEEVKESLQSSLNEGYSDFFMVDKKVEYTGKTIVIHLTDNNIEYEFEKYLEKVFTQEYRSEDGFDRTVFTALDQEEMVKFN